MAKWDAGRFLNTVNYFEAIPVFSDIRRWLKGKPTDDTIDGGRSVGVVLVIGATSDVGELVVRQLTKSGYRVRAAIADLNLTPFSVPANVEYMQASAALERLWQDVRAVILCPDAGTDLDNLLAPARQYLPTDRHLQLFDFTHASGDLRSRWGAVDDVVMGGISESGIRMMDGYAVFSGNVSTENSGGFASVRTKNFQPSLNLSNYQGIALRVNGDGQRYKFFIRTEEAWDGIGYAYSFETIANEWQTIRIPFRDLIPIFRAKTVNNAPPIDPSCIRSFQLMLSKFEYDGALNPHFTPGLFSLRLAEISAYDGQNLPQLVVIARPALGMDIAQKIQSFDRPYTIVRWEHLDPQMVADIAVRSIARPEAVGQVLGR